MAAAMGTGARSAKTGRLPSHVPPLRCASTLALLTFPLWLAGIAGCGNDDDPAAVPDATPPAAVHLTPVFAPGRVLLGWTAPGDDGEQGRATCYDLRYTGSSLTEANWDSAAAVPCPEPQEAGSAELVEVNTSAFTPGEWRFALRTADEVPNWSALSNVVSVTVQPPADVDPPGAERT